MSPAFYEFGPFRMDVVRRVLLRDGQVTPVSPKVFDTLLELLKHAGRAVSKEALLSAVWPDAAVEENSLVRSISSLRKALGESTADHQYIVTVPGRGYQFVATVREESTGYDGDGRVKRPYRIHRMLGVAALAAALPAAALLRIAVTPRATPFETTITTKVTSSGKAMKAALSPDGRSIAYVPEESGLESLKLKETASLRADELVPPAAGRYMGIAFSPDGLDIYYVIRGSAMDSGTLYRVPITGGPARKLKENVESGVALSPDGKRYAFLRESEMQSAIVVAAVDSGEEHTVLSRKPPQLVDYPAWSPDARTIACTTFDSSKTDRKSQILKIDVASGKSSLLSGHTWGFIHEMSWLPDGSGMVVNARTQQSSPFHVWLVSNAGDTVRKLSDGLNSQWGASISRDGRDLVTIDETWYSSLWRVAAGQRREPKILLSNVTGKSMPVWLRDGGILFEQALNGSSTLWTLQPDGKDQTQFPLPPDSYHAAVSRDGKHLAYVSDVGGTTGIWTVERDGKNPLRVANTPGWFPDVSPDGKWVVYASPGPQYWTTLWRVGFRGEARRILNDDLWERPAISPDGKWIAGFYADQRLTTQTHPGSLAVIGFEGGRPSRVFPIRRTMSPAAGLRWTPDGNGLAYVDSGRDGDNIWIQPLNGGDAHQITEFHDGDTIFGFDWSADGKELVFSRGVQSRDVVVIHEAGKK